MKTNKLTLIFGVLFLLTVQMAWRLAAESADLDAGASSTTGTEDVKMMIDSEDEDISKAKAIPADSEEVAPPPVAPPKKSSSKRADRADAFLAGPDWEFDGFVAGGQEEEKKSMFYLQDLLYINLGTAHGFTSGDKVGIYKRGRKVKDPQSGKFLGYEVRRAAFSRLTDKVSKDFSSARIIQTFEPVEIGDLVRREE